MSLLTLHVRLNPLRSCPMPTIPPSLIPIVGLHYDLKGPTPTIKHLYVRLLPTNPVDFLSGTYKVSTRTANIDVGLGLWSDLSGWLGSQPFIVTVSTSPGSGADIENVDEVDFFAPIAAAPRIASPSATNLGRDVFAVRREVTSIRSLAADMLTELSEVNSTLQHQTRREHDPHTHPKLKHDSEPVPSGEFDGRFSGDPDLLTSDSRGR